jgi:H+/gluconate symporter-like permease
MRKCNSPHRLVIVALALAVTVFAFALPAPAPAQAAGGVRPQPATNCGIGFRCCPRLGACLCYPDHLACP